MVDPETGAPWFYAGHGKCVPCYKARQKARREAEKKVLQDLQDKVELQKDFDRLVNTYGLPDHLKGREEGT